MFLSKTNTTSTEPCCLLNPSCCSFLPQSFSHTSSCYHCCCGCWDSTCTVQTHTHVGTQPHTGATPGTHLCHWKPGYANSYLCRHGSSPPALLRSLQWLQAHLLQGTLAVSFLSSFLLELYADSLVGTCWVLCLLAWSHSYVCLGRKCPSSVGHFYIKTCTY